MAKTINLIKAALILASVLALCVCIGLLAGQVGIPAGLTIGILFNLFVLFLGDKAFIATMCAIDADRKTHATLVQLVARLADQAGLPMPRVVVCPQALPNAFALGLGPKYATIGFTQGALDHLTLEELRGVIGHELAHIKNRDTLLSSVVAGIAGAITNLSLLMFRGRGFGWGLQRVVLMSVPLAAAVVRLSISRGREFKADRDGAVIAGSSEGLISALIKMDALARQGVTASAPINDHLLTVGPPPIDRLSALFSTHPPIQDRVKRLEQHATNGGLSR